MTMCQSEAQASKSCMFSLAFTSAIGVRSACLDLLACSYPGENDRNLGQSPPKAKNESAHSQWTDWQIFEMQ